jgi:putative membrane protein
MKLVTRQWTILAAMLASAPAWAVSLATTGPAQPVPDQGVATVALPIAENLASGSAALVPLMAADPQADEIFTIDTNAPGGGGDVGKPIDDISFLSLAANGGRVELGAARDALVQLTDPELKRVAEALARDHADTTARLEKIAQEKQWPMPAVQKREAPPAGTASADYDQAWIDETISAHERLAALYGAQAEGGEDQDLRRFARETLPTLRHHLAELRRLQK